MDALTWVLLGILAYWILMVVLNRRGLLPTSVRVNGPITTVRTQRGKAFLDRLSRFERFWRAWANVGIGFALVVMVASFVFLLLSAVAAIREPQASEVTQPRNVLVIPGVNEFLPMSVAPEIVLGLLVGLVVHEGGHGLLCRVEDIEIESMGVALFTFVPIGAFVEPSEESQEAADRGGRTRMFAAGVTNNFAITILAFVLLFGPVAGSIAVAPGAAVGTPMPGSAAEEAGIQSGDRITGVGGRPVDSNDDLQELLANTTDRDLAVTIDGEREVSVERSVLVTGATPDGPTGIDVGDTIVAVDGEAVHTIPDLRGVLESTETVTASVRGADGETSEHTFPVGAFATVVPDGPFAAAGAPEEAQTVIVGVDDERIVSGGDLTDALAGTDPGDEVVVAAYVDGEREEYSVVLGGDGDRGTLGVRVAPGISGLSFDDFGVQYYPVDRYLALLGGGADDTDLNPAITDSFIGKTMFTLFLPIAGFVGGEQLPYNFPGFTEDVLNFVVVDGPLEFLGGGVFVAANVLFWIGWINVNLGFFNCIPAFPLDGGHILRTSTEAIVSRLPIEASYEMTKVVTITVGATMVASFLLLVFGPMFLS